MSVRLVRPAVTAALVLCLAGAALAQEPRQPVEELTFRPDPDLGLSEADLQQQVRSNYSGLPPASRAQEVPQVVKRILVGEGFRRATVSSALEQFGTPARTRLVVTINAGPRTTIATVEITGKSSFTRAAILERTGAAVDGPFREREIAKNLAALRAELRQKGFYKAVAVLQAHYLDDERRADVTLKVDAGPSVRIVYKPDKSYLPSGNVENFVPIAQEQSVEQDLLEDAVRAIEDGLRREGYWKAHATYSQDDSRPGELIVTFEITRGKRYKIDHLELPETLRIPRAVFDAEPGLKSGVWFSAARVSNALRRIVVRQYWEIGYYQAVEHPEFKEMEEPPGRASNEGRVIIAPGISEGVRATIREVQFSLGASPRIGEATLRGVMASRQGGPFVALTALADRERLQAYYDDQGFLGAEVAIDLSFNEDGTQATLGVVATEGPRRLIGSILIVGNKDVGDEVIKREITLKEGEPFSEARRLDSQRRLLDTGFFRNATIVPEALGVGETVQLTVSVVEAPAMTVGSGGGVEMAKRTRTVEDGVEERVEFSPRAFLEITRRNLGGKNRTASFFARLGLQPTNAPGDPARDGKGWAFSDYKASGTYRERYAFQSNTDILTGFTAEQGIRQTFSFTRQIINADAVHQLRKGLAVSARYALEFNNLFDERIAPEDQPEIDRLFPQVRLSIVGSGIALDRRQNLDGQPEPLAPSKGYMLTGSADVAMRPIGSEIGYVKTFVQGLYFYPLVKRNPLTVLALRAQLGLARGFERTVEQLDENGNPVLGPDGQPVVEVVADLPASQRFYAGGSTTVRGFGVDRLGVPEILDENGLSNGGNGMVILNAELRVTVGNLLKRPLVAVAFVDGGNIFQFSSDLDFGRLRGSSGVGVRWDSPVGPLRLDIGRKMSRMIFQGGPESKFEWHFSLGHAF
jgi:outer membrane protein insertion porin family